MANRDSDVDGLVVRDGANFSATQLKALADGTDLKDAVTLEQLNAVAVGSGWDEAQFDDSNGNLKFSIATVLNETVNLDGRYTTEVEVNALITAAAQSNFKISLGTGSTVQQRIDNAISVPSGWTLTASGLDLIITHNLGRFIGDITVWAKTPVLTYQKLLNTAAYSGLNASDDAVLVQSLATVSADINIHIIFGE